MTNLVYHNQTNTFTKHEVSGGKLIIAHQQERTTPKVGDRVAIGRLYAMLHAGVVLDSSGRILEIRAVKEVA